MTDRVSAVNLLHCWTHRTPDHAQAHGPWHRVLPSSRRRHEQPAEKQFSTKDAIESRSAVCPAVFSAVPQISPRHSRSVRIGWSLRARRSAYEHTFSTSKAIEASPSSSHVLDRTADINTPSRPVRIVPRPMRKPPKALCMNGRALNEKDHRSVSFYAPSAVFDRAADIITPFHAQ
jgi:hypothetical protein